MVQAQEASGGFHPIRWTREAAGTTWYGMKKAGYIATKAAVFAGVSVPGAALVAEAVNAIARPIKGHDVLPGFIDMAGDKTAPMLDGSVPEQVAGIVARADLAAISAAHTLSQFGSEASDVVTSWMPEAWGGPVDVGVDMAVDLGIAAGAGYGAAKLATVGPTNPRR